VGGDQAHRAGQRKHDQGEQAELDRARLEMGSSTRSISRTVDVSINTVAKLLVGGMRGLS